MAPGLLSSCPPVHLSSCPSVLFYFVLLFYSVLLQVPRGTAITENIVIGTPGKVLDWGLKFRLFDLAKIRVFVLDEADVMIATQVTIVT